MVGIDVEQLTVGIAVLPIAAGTLEIAIGGLTLLLGDLQVLELVAVGGIIVSREDGSDATLIVEVRSRLDNRHILLIALLIDLWRKVREVEDGCVLAIVRVTIDLAVEHDDVRQQVLALGNLMSNPGCSSPTCRDRTQ